MTEHFSSSPGRTPSISRPEWPWSPLAYARRNTHTSSTHSTSSTPGPALSGWETRSSMSSATNLGTSYGINNPSRLNNGPMSGPAHEESTRQWTFMAFEWVVRDIMKLQNFVEGVEDNSEPGQTGDFEILQQSPMLGDSRYKLEIALTPRGEDIRSHDRLPTLSLYITSLIVDFARGDYETSASMMAAIKCQDDRPGERGSRPEWIWEHWQNDWVFRQGSEVWECPLPPISTLLKNSRVRSTNSFVVCVQIHSPIGPSMPQQPSYQYVPCDLLDGLENLLDNSNTGDVRFICLERMNHPESSPTNISQGASASRPISSASSHSSFPSTTTARKRIIYAHSDILKHRSEYFATMLSSSFSEGSHLATSERKMYTVVVEEADFETVYWLLKYCYANWLLFKEHDDPRAAVEGVGLGWSANWLNTRDGEWDWKTFHKAGLLDDSGGDSRSAASGDSLSTSGINRNDSATSDAYHQNVLPANSTSGMEQSSTNAKSPINPSSASRSTNSSSRRSVPSSSSSITMAVGGTSSIPRSKAVSIPVPASNFQSPTHFPISPRSARQQSSLVSTPDPHPHPTLAPAPASALLMYQVAHRYSMPSLASLALEHIMSTLNPQSSFALLLATSAWDELHSLVEDYVIDKWDEVSVSVEFELCCQEVAAGEWGLDGGRTLTAVFRRLRSPSSATS